MEMFGRLFLVQFLEPLWFCSIHLQQFIMPFLIQKLRKAQKARPHFYLFPHCRNIYTFLARQFERTCWLDNFGIIWGLALIGTILKLCTQGSGTKIWSIALYLIMGWMIVLPPNKWSLKFNNWVDLLDFRRFVLHRWRVLLCLEKQTIYARNLAFLRACRNNHALFCNFIFLCLEIMLYFSTKKNS